LKAFIDTPLFIYLNTLANDRERALYENFYLEILSRYKPYTDVLVLDELIYVSRKKYGIPYKITLEFIDSIILPYVTIIPLGEEEYMTSAVILHSHNLKPSGALHLAAMKNHGINVIVSEDSEYDRVRWVRRVWLGYDQV